MPEKDAQIIEAAIAVFTRYGFRRATMGDLAEAMGISRPALYQRFNSKEQVLDAAIQHVADKILTDIRTGMAGLDSPAEQLRLAMELWVVAPYVVVSSMPDAKDLVDCSLTFAKERLESCSRTFEALLREILEKIPPCSEPEFSSARIAALLTKTAKGARMTAQDEASLRNFLHDIIQVTLAALRQA